MSKPFQGIGASWQKADKKLGVIYVPPQQELAVEIVNGYRRYAEHEVSVGKSLLANVALNGFNAWLGVNPYFLVANVALEASAVASKRSLARKKAAPFLEILSVEPKTKAFADELERQMANNHNLGFPGYKMMRISSEPFDSRDGYPYFELLGTEQLLVIGALVAFTPKFEALEVSVVYGVLEKSNDEVVVRYHNAVLVQSISRKGLDGQDTRNEIIEMVGAERTRKLSKIGEPGSKRDWRMAQNRKKLREIVLKESKRKIIHLQTNYDDFDDADEWGSRWLADEGQALKDHLEASYAEAARLVVLDLASTNVDANSTVDMPPGYSVQMTRLPNFDTAHRNIYRLDEGQLLSIHKHSRMIPLSSDF